MSTQAQTQTQTQTPDFVISRTFDAPRELVWQAFTDPARMKAMVGPEGLYRHRLQDGFSSRRHLSLRHAGARRQRDVGQVHLSRDRPAVAHGAGQFVLRRGRRHHTSSDESPTWPREMLSTFVFEDEAAVPADGETGAAQRQRRRDRTSQALATACSKAGPVPWICSYTYLAKA